MRTHLPAGSRHRRRPSSSILAFGLLAAVVASTTLAGCYRRVVGVKGDASSYDGKVYEPNLKPGEDNVVKGLFETRTVRPVEDP
ncbi:MAG: hypothetical protein ACO38W_08750 [Phycisphaerales bacterium]|jgi:hypothetical protein